MNENELYVVKEFKFDKPLSTKIGPMIQSCYRDRYNKHFHTFIFFIYECIYYIKLKNITDNEVIIFTMSGRGMILYELNKKLKVSRHNGFIFN